MKRPTIGPRGIGPCEAGTSAVEFALLAPVFCLLLVGAVDFGGMLYTSFNLDGAVSAAGDYAIVNASAVTASGGAALAAQVAMIAAAGHAANWSNASVVVNNGPVATPDRRRPDDERHRQQCG